MGFDGAVDISGNDGMGEDNLRFDSQSGLMRERTPAKCRRDVYRVTVSDHLIVMPGCRIS